MTLRVKVIISVLIALAVSAALIYGISHTLLIREIVAIEADEVRRDVSVAQRAIQRELDELDKHVFDYAAWDDTYEFMASPTEAYIASNLPDNVYESLGLNLLAYLRLDGSVAYGRVYDREAGSSSILPASLADLWGPRGPFLSVALTGTRISGIVNTEEGTFLVASRPILTSEEGGPARGVAIMARQFNTTLTEALRAQTQLNITPHVLDAPGVVPMVSEALVEASSSGAITVKPLDGHLISGFETLTDIYDRPAVLLEVQSDRVMYEQAKKALGQYLWIILGTIGVLGIAVNLALSGWILRPLRKLVSQVKGLATGHARISGKRIELSKGAEFGALGKEINHLLDELEAAHNEIAQLYGQAREQADRDPVTGLMSRRAIFEGLERRLTAARERGGKLAVLMIDVDRFKNFNDAYGHLAGDSVLRIVSKEIASRTREGDLAGRYGGDEILVVLPNTDADGAVAQAARLLEAMNALAWKAPDGTDVPISLSIGVSAFPSHASEVHELLAFADANLYAVKQRGRRAVSSGASADAAGPSEYGFGMLDSLITALSEKDQYTRRHAEEVASMAVRIAEALGLEDRVVRAIRIAGLLHDVGKTGIPASLLLRPGPLTDQEAQLVRRHVDIGLALIRDVPELDEVLAAVGSHHENVDGTGYPNALTGDQIPLSGRVLAVADAYSAMTSFRPYRRARTHEQADRELRNLAGHQLDERLVEVFLSAYRPQPEQEHSSSRREDRTASPAKRLAGEGVS